MWLVHADAHAQGSLGEGEGAISGAPRGCSDCRTRQGTSGAWCTSELPQAAAIALEHAKEMAVVQFKEERVQELESTLAAQKEQLTEWSEQLEVHSLSTHTP